MARGSAPYAANSVMEATGTPYSSASARGSSRSSASRASSSRTSRASRSALAWTPRRTRQPRSSALGPLLGQAHRGLEDVADGLGGVRVEILVGTEQAGDGFGRPCRGGWSFARRVPEEVLRRQPEAVD